MKKELIHKLSLRYNILPELIEKYLPLTREFDLHIYDIVALYDKYKNDKAVRENAEDYKFTVKVDKWLNSDYKIYNTKERFVPAGTHYQKHGFYTDAPRNPHPSSTYMQFWKEEARRSLYGYYNGGEWITGYHYFYLNYTPIELAEKMDNTQIGDNVQGEKVVKLPLFWDSDFFYFHYLEEAERHGMSAAVLKTRRRGYSWKAASMLDRNFFLIPRSRSIIYASSNEYLLGQDGVLTKAWSQMTFIDKNTAWSKRRQKKDTETYKRASLVKKVNGVDVEDGFLSEIAGVTLKNDPDKVRGKSAKLILFEEAGSFDNLIRSWIISEPSIKQGKISFGLRVAFGTGGEEGPGFQGLRKFFYEPDGYNIYALPNIWTAGGNKNKVSWFQPEYMNREDYYDKDGNSDIDAAKENIYNGRERLINSGADSETLLRTKAEGPIVPEDAMLRTSASPFPRALIKEQQIRLEDSTVKGSSYKGGLSLDSTGNVVWRENAETHIITSHMPTKLNRVGGIEVYEKPIDAVKESSYGYIIGVDPIDYDYSEVGDKYSLGSCFVMNTFTKKIVAEYTGRPDLADTFYETVKRLAIYYNASVMYENNIKGLHTYFVNQMSEHLLAYKPRILDDGDVLIKTGRKKYGYVATPRVNKFGLELLKKWMLEPLEEYEGMRRLNTIQSKGLLNELLDWNPDGNFDRVSSMIALLILYQDVSRLLDEVIGGSNNDDANNFWKSPFA